MASILVVDDEAALRDLLTLMLSEIGHSVLTAADGVEALARIEQEHIDLILTDLLMPNMTGVELIATLRGRGLSQPIIAMTGGARTGGPQQLQALAAGADHLADEAFPPGAGRRRRRGPSQGLGAQTATGLE